MSICSMRQIIRVIWVTQLQAGRVGMLETCRAQLNLMGQWRRILKGTLFEVGAELLSNA